MGIFSKIVIHKVVGHRRKWA